MIKMLSYLDRSDWGRIALALIFILIQIWMDLSIPSRMSEITRLVQTPGSETREILLQGLIMLACAVLALICALMVGLLASQMSAHFASELRRRLYEKVDSFSAGEMTRFSAASLITRSTNDVTQVQLLVGAAVRMLIKAPITAVWAIARIWGKGFEWTMATVVAVLILVVMLIIVMSLVVPKFRLIQGLTDRVNRNLREDLGGLRIVRAYNAKEHRARAFAEVNDELTRTGLFAQRGIAIVMPGMRFIMNLLMLSIYWIGAYLISRATLGDRLTYFSDMVVFSSYAIQVLISFMLFAMLFVLIPRAEVSAKRIHEVLETETAIKEGTSTGAKPGHEGEIKFQNVGFRYPGADEWVLCDISFTARKGETIAVIGSTGSGKSTLAMLIPRFYDASCGEIMVGGRNVREYQTEALRNKIAYVSQQARIFSGTIRSNIDFGDNGRGQALTDSEIRQAAEIAQATEFIDKLDDAYESSVAQNGSNLSGGQKQRLSIARAVARQPEIFIFDDSFSALDFKTDRALRHALDEHVGAATRLIVAQRIGTVMNADKILVLDEGRMVGQGTHEELLKTCEVYREIAESQLSEEELS